MRYGLRALVQIAEAPQGRVVPVRRIARLQRIPAKYLEHIVSALKTAGMIRSSRGPRGGYVMARPPGSLRLDAVVRALDGPPEIVGCVDRPETCRLRQTCPVRQVWIRVRQAIDATLASFTIEDLVKASRSLAKAPPDWAI